MCAPKTFSEISLSLNEGGFGEISINSGEGRRLVRQCGTRGKGKEAGVCNPCSPEHGAAVLCALLCTVQSADCLHLSRHESCPPGAFSWEESGGASRGIIISVALIGIFHHRQIDGRVSCSLP